MSCWDKFIAWCQRDETWFWPWLLSDVYLSLEDAWEELVYRFHSRPARK